MRSLVVLEAHQGIQCKTCNLATVVKKGGRPSKPKRGRGKLSAAASQKRQTESEVADFCAMVNGLVENLPSVESSILEKTPALLGRFQKSTSVPFVQIY